MGLSVSHIVLVLVVFLLLFGIGKLPRLMADLAKGIKSFRQGMQDDDAHLSQTSHHPSSHNVSKAAQRSLSQSSHNERMPSTATPGTSPSQVALTVQSPAKASTKPKKLAKPAVTTKDTSQSATKKVATTVKKNVTSSKTKAPSAPTVKASKTTQASSAQASKIAPSKPAAQKTSVAKKSASTGAKKPAPKR